jgi:hypothetical protein
MCSMVLEQLRLGSPSTAQPRAYVQVPTLKLNPAESATPFFNNYNGSKYLYPVQYKYNAWKGLSLTLLRNPLLR